MKLITFGLGGAKAIFLRLGFGSTAAQAEQEDSIHGGLLRGQFKPVIPRRPILLGVRVVSRGRITLCGRGRVERRLAAVAYIALAPLRGRGAIAGHRVSVGRGGLSAGGGSRIARSKAHQTHGRVALIARCVSSCVREQTSTWLIGIAGRGKAAGTKHHRAKAAVVCSGRASVSRISTYRTVSRARVSVCGRASSECSTLGSRIEIADRRDLDLILLLAA